MAFGGPDSPQRAARLPSVFLKLWEGRVDHAMQARRRGADAGQLRGAVASQRRLGLDAEERAGLASAEGSLRYTARAWAGRAACACPGAASALSTAARCRPPSSPWLPIDPRAVPRASLLGLTSEA